MEYAKRQWRCPNMDALEGLQPGASLWSLDDIISAGFDSGMLLLLEPHMVNLTLQEAMDRAALGPEGFAAKQQLEVESARCRDTREAALDQVREGGSGLGGAGWGYCMGSECGWGRVG